MKTIFKLILHSK